MYNKVGDNMRNFYIFKIKKEYANITRNNPYHLYRSLEQIYYMDKSEVILGLDFFDRLIEPINQKDIDIDIFKKHKDNYFYTKYRNVHKIHNVYKKEHSTLNVYKTYLTLESNVIRPTFLRDLVEYDNLFLCDFENKDYLWLEKLFVGA